MKRKIFGILFAVVLVLPLSLVITVPAMATPATIDVSPVKNITNTGNVSGNDYYERDPQLLIASSGTWYLIYSRSQTSFTAGGNCDALLYDIYYQTSTDDGVSWSSPTKVLDAVAISANANFRSATICEADGKIWVIGANVENLEGDIYANTYYGGSWSGQSMIFDGTYNTGAYHVDAIAEGDDIRLFYGIQNESNGVGFIKYDGSADTWGSSVTQIGASAGYQTPRVIKEDSTYHLVSTNWENVLYTSTTTPDTVPWPDAVSIATAPSDGAACDQTIVKYGDSGGTVDLLVFHAPAYSDESQPIEYVYSTDGGTTWSASIPFTDALHGINISWDMMPRAYMKDADTVMVFFGMEQRGVNRGQADIVLCEWSISSTIGNAHYTTIQDAVDNAIAGDTINVAMGTYAESLTIDKDDLSIVGDAASKPMITGGLKFDTNLTGLTFQNFQVSGNAVVGRNSIVIMYGAITDLTIDNCVFDGENISGRDGFSGGQLEGDVTVMDSEFKDILGWALFESYWGSGGDGSAMVIVTFANNYIHDSNGSVVFRGLSTNRTHYVHVYGNTWNEIGGNGNEQGEQWAALEVNRANHAYIYDNTISGVAQGKWGEGQALQLWDITELDVHGNTITDCYQGIFILGSDPFYPTSLAVPRGTIHSNDIYGNMMYGIWVDEAATGGPLDATYNWWGSSTGPRHQLPNKKWVGKGDKVSSNVDFVPWLPLPIEFWRM